jgi:hypothetical protein
MILVISGTVSLVIALLSWHWLEKRCLALQEYFGCARTATPGSRATVSRALRHPTLMMLPREYAVIIDVGNKGK